MMARNDYNNPDNWVTKSERYLIGLDLGQAQDYTALTIFRQFNRKFRMMGTGGYCHNEKREKQELQFRYQLRHLKRFKLGMTYTEQVDKTMEIISKTPKPITLVVDGTGVGKPVVDLFRQRITSHRVGMVPVTITGGNSVTKIGRSDSEGFTVPKRDLVGNLQVLFHDERLKISSKLEGVDTLIHELLNFRAKITTSAHDSYEAWREKDHDDLVLSAALACWYGEHKPPVDYSGIKTLNRQGRWRGLDDDEPDTRSWI